MDTIDTRAEFSDRIAVSVAATANRLPRPSDGKQQRESDRVSLNKSFANESKLYEDNRLQVVHGAEDEGGWRFDADVDVDVEHAPSTCCGSGEFDACTLALYGRACYSSRPASAVHRKFSEIK